jgi:pimeloyl-ACP methyl ester carboxylesterase
VSGAGHATLVLATAAAVAGMPACARWPESPRGPAGVEAQFVAVDANVRLEVLDWGGAGQPLVLLAGSGNTAHVFDDFARQLTGCCRVYGVTRRGYGASSRPAAGYDDQRLADDVLAVLNSLKIDAPVLVGHSMAGGELTTLGNQQSHRLAGLVYLDALADPRDFPANDAAYMALFGALPAAMRNSPPLDYTSFEAYRDSQRRSGQGAFPESELREAFVENPDGSMGFYKASNQAIHNAIGQGQKKRDYSGIRVPVLAFLEFPRPTYDPALDRYHPKNEAERAAIEAVNRATAAYVERWMTHMRSSVGNVRFVNLTGAGHFVFLTREADVVRELRAFVDDLPR